MRYGLIAICATMMLSGPAVADPWKDESGNGLWRDGRGGYDRGYAGRYEGQGVDQGRGEYEGRGGYGERRRYGEGRRGRDSYNMDRDYNEEYRRGNCKVERKWEGDGGYKAETKCKGGYR